MFAVLFVMMFLGILFIQFHVNSQHAKRSSHRFLTSEMARQIAAAAQEEAFMYLYKQTDNPNGDDYNTKPIMKQIIDRDSSVLLDTNGNMDRSSGGITLNIDATKKMIEENDYLKGCIDVEAKARLIDFRDVDYDHMPFYGKEGLGTIEIAVTVKPKEEYKTKLPGACTMIRHHDYKVIALLTKSDRDKYFGGSVLDYALFMKNGQSGFESSKGMNINSQDITLLVDPTSVNGLVHFGSSGSNYQYLNVSTSTIDFIGGDSAYKNPVKIFEANSDEINKFFPSLWENMKAKDDDNKLESIKGHKALFYQCKYPMVEGFCESEDLKATLINAVMDAQMAGKNVAIIESDGEKKPYCYEGIKIATSSCDLSEVLKSDIRKQYLNYGYFEFDFSNFTIRYDGENVTREQLNGEEEFVKGIKDLDGKRVVCWDYEKSALYKTSPDSPFFSSVKLDKLKEVIRARGEDEGKVFTYVNDKYDYGKNEEHLLMNNPDYYDTGSSLKNENITNFYPYNFYNLFNKFDLTSNEVESLCVYDREKNELYLRGINCANTYIEFGDPDNPNNKLKIKGSGVLIANRITINCGVERDSSNPDSVCVLYSYGDIIINTSEKINASLIAMSENLNATVRCNKLLNLEGSLAADNINLLGWAKGEHRITYDKALAPTRDVYQITFNKSVSFERVIEKE